MKVRLVMPGNTIFYILNFISFMRIVFSLDLVNLTQTNEQCYQPEKSQVAILSAGMHEDFRCNALQPLLTCALINVSVFPAQPETESLQERIDKSVQVIEEYLRYNQVDYMISASRGATLLAEAVYRSSWLGASIFISPILLQSNATAEDDYDGLIELLSVRGPPALFITGTSQDERFLIEEPIREALVSRRKSPSLFLKSFEGDHDLSGNVSAWLPVISKARSLGF